MVHINQISKQKHFYKTLFTSESTSKTEAPKMLDNIDKSLKTEEREFCDEEVTEQEISNANKVLKTNKSPAMTEFSPNFTKNIGI